MPEVTGKVFLPQPAQSRAGVGLAERLPAHVHDLLRRKHRAHVIGAGGRALTSVPSGAMISTARNVPSLRGRSASKNEAIAAYTAEYVFASEEFLKPRICGAVPVKSTVNRSPAMVSATRMRMSAGSKQSLSKCSSAR